MCFECSDTLGSPVRWIHHPRRCNSSSLRLPDGVPYENVNSGEGLMQRNLGKWNCGIMGSWMSMACMSRPRSTRQIGFTGTFWVFGTLCPSNSWIDGRMGYMDSWIDGPSGRDGRTRRPAKVDDAQARPSALFPQLPPRSFHDEDRALFSRTGPAEGSAIEQARGKSVASPRCFRPARAVEGVR
jgi:hypothetical protein